MFHQALVLAVYVVYELALASIHPPHYCAAYITS